MRVSQIVLHKRQPEPSDLSALAVLKPQLVLAFGSVEALQGAGDVLAQVFSDAHRLGCSTAGEISSSGVTEAMVPFTKGLFSPDLGTSCLNGSRPDSWHRVR